MVVVKPAPAPQPEPAVAPRLDPQIAIERDKRLERERRQHDDAERADAVKRALAAKQADAVKQADAARRAEAERDKLRAADALADKKKLADKARQDDARQAAARDAFLRRAISQAGSSDDAGATGSAARTSGPSAGYGGRIKARIKPNIVALGAIDGNPTASVEVRLAQDGTIVGRKLVKSSGSAAWDETVLRAIDKTGILPRDVDGRVPSTMLIDFRPQE